MARPLLFSSPNLRGGKQQQKEETTKEIGAKKCCTVATVVALDQFRETGTPLFPPSASQFGVVCLFVCF
jgi:hypothetical protein